MGVVRFKTAKEIRAMSPKALEYLMSRYNGSWSECDELVDYCSLVFDDVDDAEVECVVVDEHQDVRLTFRFLSSNGDLLKKVCVDYIDLVTIR